MYRCVLMAILNVVQMSYPSERQRIHSRYYLIAVFSTKGIVYNNVSHVCCFNLKKDISAVRHMLRCHRGAPFVFEVIMKTSLQYRGAILLTQNCYHTTYIGELKPV